MEHVTLGRLAWLRADEVGSRIPTIQKNLTLVPRATSQYSQPHVLHLWEEDRERGLLGVPREWFLAKRTREYETTYDYAPDVPAFLSAPFASGEKTLRDEQKKALVAFLRAFREDGRLGGILQAPTGWGKCLGLGTLVLKYDGSIVSVEDVRPGDLLMGPDGSPRCVSSTTRGIGPLYRIVPTVGNPWVCNDAHILTLVHTETDTVVDVPLKDWFRLSKWKKHCLKQFAPPNGVEFPATANLPLDPYFLGVWFGDGTKNIFGRSPSVAITTADVEIERLCYEVANRFGLRVRRQSQRNNKSSVYYIVANHGGAKNTLLDALRLTVGGGLSLPPTYLRASRVDRLQFLAGWLDTDGYHNNGCYELTQKRRDWAEGVAYLARSLGLRATVKPCEKRNQHGVGGTYWMVKMAGDFYEVPLRIARKAPRKRLQKKIATRTGFSVEELGVGEYAGFTLDGDGRFLLGDFTVTHNTTWALALLAELRLRALVLVHKEFLMSQWEERAQEFLPGVRVGFMQGDRCDTDVDLCIGMIQSLAQREYPPEAYRAFSVVVSDETHRVAASTWAAVVPKFHARLRLGITATPRRKDCAENVFFWHIGPILFRARHLPMEPLIRWIRTGFSFVQVPGQSSMETRPRAIQLRVLCANERRNKLIVDEMAQAIAHGRKVMVLSERLNHLHRLAHLFNDDPRCKDASWAYYVGSMKEEALEESARARVIFATSQMASEGLDIPELDTLMLVTPTSDPEQAVGRILRLSPGKQQPIVVDFVDDVGWCEKLSVKRGAVYARLRDLAAATPPLPRAEPRTDASLTAGA